MPATLTASDLEDLRRKDRALSTRRLPRRTYHYRAGDRTVRRRFESGCAPYTIEVDGVTYRRYTPSFTFSPGISKAAGAPGAFRAGVTRVIPKWTPGFRHDAKGRCIIESNRQRVEYMRRHKLEFTDDERMD